MTYYDNEIQTEISEDKMRKLLFDFELRDMTDNKNDYFEGVYNIEEHCNLLKMIPKELTIENVCWRLNTCWGCEIDNELERAKKLIEDFCQKEYESEPDFTDLSNIPLAYTMNETETKEIQVNADLINFRLNTYINKELKETLQYYSLEEFNRIILENLEFDGLTEMVYDEE